MGEIHALRNMDDDEVFAYAKRIAAPYNLVMQTKQLGRLPVVQFAAGGVATPADAALMMQLGCDGVFVASGIFKSGDPARRARAIVQSVTHCRSSRPSTLPPRRPCWHTFAVELCPNRYMVMEAFIDTAGKDQSDPLILTQLNSTKAIRDSIQINFGECGLAACLGSLQGIYELYSSIVKYVNPITKLCVIRVSREDHQKVWAAITMVRSIGKIPVSFNLRDVSGSIRACKKAALECEEAKFEYYKLAAGDRITPKFVETMESCFNKD
uniref:pyridoxal 5'-phosphate synthase (glutamine hydrolyzing) n=1 Tax=Oryza sativa subsp. japonica TaxID=39947 RepID=Q53WN7_ORYSJ|nr:unknown protein [Oryza sativa Japonica Group]